MCSIIAVINNKDQQSSITQFWTGSTDSGGESAMKKAFLSVLIILVVVIAGGVYYLFSNLDNIVKAAIEKYASETTHTAVAVEDVVARWAVERVIAIEQKTE